MMEFDEKPVDAASIQRFAGSNRFGRFFTHSVASCVNCGKPPESRNRTYLFCLAPLGADVDLEQEA